MDWNDLRYVLALARTGSVRAAGERLGVSHSTVLRRVEAIEAELGTRIFDRSRSGFSLTEAGQDMIPRAERIEAEIAALERGIAGRDSQLAGRISITCGDVWVADIVLRGLRDFCDQHPGIGLHVGVEGRLFDMTRREADIAVRALPRGAQPPDQLIGTKLAPLLLGNYVGVDHADRLNPDRPGVTTRWAAFDDPDIQQRLAANTAYSHLPSWGGFSNLGVLVSAVRHGLGVGMLPTYIGDVEPSLRRLAHPGLVHLGDLWLLSHPDLRKNARLRACRQVLIATFGDATSRFDGTGPLAQHPL